MRQQKKNGVGSRAAMALLFVFLYAPIFVLMVFSFNDSSSRTVWKGFTLRWYGELLQDSIILNSIYTTLLVALLSAIIATVAGTFAAIGFYNMRRREMLGKEPNAGHRAIAGLEECFDVEVITQNVDNLHERAGSSRVTHLHGELTKLRSSRDPELIVPIDGWEQRLDATAPDGALLRPHIVFFGEAVPMFERAAEIAGTADLMVVVGTSLAVYPAASLVRYVRPDVPIFLVDPGNPDTAMIRNPLTHIRSRAAEGMPELAERLKSEFS